MTQSLEWPVPPPFMWTCAQCASLLAELAENFARAEDDVYDDSPLRTQLTLSRHIAAEHPSAVPEPHGDECGLCASYGTWGDRPVIWAEHRARDLFLPEAVARLL
jgi:hypothetical protein